MTKPDVQRLAAAVRSRREFLHMAQADLKQHGGPGVVTVGQIERGAVAQPSGLTLAKLDLALRWQHGSAKRVLDGGEPTLAEENAGLAAEVDRPSVGAGAQDAEDALFRLPPGLTPRQRENALRIAQGAIREYLATLEDEED